MAAQREPVQAVDELGAVLPVAREREMLAHAAVGLRHVHVGERVRRLERRVGRAPAEPLVAVEPAARTGPSRARSVLRRPPGASMGFFRGAREGYFLPTR